MSKIHCRYNPYPYNKLLEVYMAEIKGLMNASSSPEFRTIIENLTSYEKFLTSRKRMRQPLKPILDASKGTRVISVNNLTPSIRQALFTAITASCCEIFRGDTIFYSQLKPEIIEESALKSLPSEDMLTDEKNLQILATISSMDSFRTMVLMRCLGLITRPSKNIYQIALGAGIGNKDIYSIHQSPVITINNTQQQTRLTFNIKQELAENTILVDADPIHREYYAALNKDHNQQISAYNFDALEALQQLSDSIISKRNLVTMLRIDHRMLPDVSKFLHYLSLVIEDDCDLIVTIGSGDTIGDFDCRVNKVKEIFDTLEHAKFRPTLLKLHQEGTIDEQWGSLRVGHPSLATYQILYCKLKRKALAKYFSHTH